MENLLETGYDYGVYDASMAVNLLMPESRNIVRMSYNFHYLKWREICDDIISGKRVIGQCCWLSCPVKRENWHKENLNGLQVASPTKGYKN